MSEENWDDGNIRCFGMLLDGRAQPTGIRQARREETTLLVIFNSWQDVVKFTLPRRRRQAGYARRHEPARHHEEPSFEVGHVYEITARSLVLFKLV